MLTLVEGLPEDASVCTVVLPLGTTSRSLFCTQAGFCQECGDSLSTSMHVTHGPCNSLNAQSSSSGTFNITQDGPSTRALKVRRTVSTHTQHNFINNLGGICAVCGDSLSTPMHVSNGPCT